MANKVLLDNHQFTTTLLQINELTAVYGSPIAPASFSLIIGEQYTVVWDGVEYECTAYDGGAMMTGMVYIGNGSGFNMPGDASQPFVIAEADGTVVVMSLLDTTANTASSHTVSIAYEDVQYAIYRSTLTAIAKSIRDKTGTTEKLSPTAMPAAIEDISGGGGGSADSRVKYVTFMDGETELIKYPVIVGDTCKNPVTAGLISAPTKASTAQYDYTFSGWSLTDGGSANSNALTNITEDRVVYTAFTSAVRYYTITYYDDDGTTVLNTESLEYGSIITYTGYRQGYLFKGWTPDITPVTCDTSYTAKFEVGYSFAESSWADIARISEAGEASKYFRVGDTREQYMGDAVGTVTVMIMAFDHHELGDKSTNKGTGVKAGMTIGMVDKGATSGKYNTVAYVLKSALPSDLADVIKPILIHTQNYTGDISYVRDYPIGFTLNELGLTYENDPSYNGNASTLLEAVSLGLFPVICNATYTLVDCVRVGTNAWNLLVSSNGSVNYSTTAYANPRCKFCV